MKTYIVLLRGINVGGHRKVPMTELREILSQAGFVSVKTYIQSGNVILQSSFSEPVKIKNSIQKLIKDHLGFDVPVLVKSRKELQRIFDDCPFPDTKKQQAYFVLLRDTPKQELVTKASEKTYQNDEYVILNDCIYLFASKGFGQSKFNMNFFERNLETSATARNYKTMLKLLSLSSD
ncbi:DUF1697 domain-containing protein [Ichthyenterobacterium sp. W332]|uniref:DUF1697 domain-containing protein n=1 Tax=Microcosmobacter mediterraneus TaxID=3075607 RepID=A0ABU2YN98_9FLAO|nr:DUF1697 domain-containing protein [Ichthyenterobacterium sp. W332]MDT0558538.1 DUF1697 domain-containing protein [Ichthyenterobacterium sp. W332]